MKLLMRLTCILALSILLSMCKKYRVVNMMGTDTDATDLVVEKGYLPLYKDSAKREIYALVDPNPELDTEHEMPLKTAFKNWVAERSLDFAGSLPDTFNIIQHTFYQCTYFISDDPVDIYYTELPLQDTTIRAYFRVEKGNLMFPFRGDSWVIRSE